MFSLPWMTPFWFIFKNGLLLKQNCFVHRFVFKCCEKYHLFFYTVTVGPDRAIFERSWQQIIIQKWSKYTMEKLMRILFRMFWIKFGQLFYQHLVTLHSCLASVFLNGQFPTSFSLDRSFQQLTVKHVQYQICWWLDSKHGSLVSETTTLPTEPQPLL